MCLLTFPSISKLGERNMSFEGSFNWARRKLKCKEESKMREKGRERAEESITHRESARSTSVSVP